MKKISIILLAFALAMTMSQCKKNEVQPVSNNEVVTITLDVNKNTGSKVVVNSATGTVDFESGDKIYVGSGGKYVGFLTHNGTNFSGNITNPTENQPLQFYFLGNVIPSETLSAGTTEECSVIISDQTEHLPVISCAASYENYVSGVTVYSAHLLNKCALVKFNVTTPSNSPICITGMKNKVTVDFTNNTLTPSQDGEVVIMLPAGSGENVEKWAVLLPQEALEEGDEGSVYSLNGRYIGVRPAISEILENEYLAGGVNIIATTSSPPIGAINGVFSASASKQVYFSQGNLQFIGSVATPYWKFADNQWDYFGISTGQNSANQNADRDLFGWGTSGYNHGAVCYQPWSTSDEWRNYIVYGLDNYNLNLYDQTGQADWGYNPISNGGNQTNQWRTPTTQEWDYIFNTRTTPSGIRFVKAKVNSKNGIILLPDNWNIMNYTLNNINTVDANYNSNKITATNWTILQQNGAVFLPAAGSRNGTSINLDILDNYGFYWSASNDNNASNAFLVLFSNSYFTSQFTSSYDGGCAVRLIQDY